MICDVFSIKVRTFAPKHTANAKKICHYVKPYLVPSVFSSNCMFHVVVPTRVYFFILFATSSRFHPHARAAKIYSCLPSSKSRKVFAIRGKVLKAEFRVAAKKERENQGTFGF